VSLNEHSIRGVSATAGYEPVETAIPEGDPPVVLRQQDIGTL